MIKKLLFSIIIFISITTLVTAQGNGAVCGAIFNDLNGDGTLNEGEPGVPGIYIVLVSAPVTEDVFVAQVTYENGNYCFTGLDQGVYQFAIEVPEGWAMNGPNMFSVTITDDSTLNGYRYGLVATMAAPKQQQSVLNLYPNPASENITIVLQNPVQSEVKIFDVSGKKLVTQAISGTESKIDISALRAGVYVAVVTSEGQANTKKFVVVR